MKRNSVIRLFAALSASALLAAFAPPAAAVDLKDFGIDLGDLGTILGGGKKGGDALGLVESILESEMPRRVGPARSYEVTLGRTGNDLLKGRLGRADIVGLDVRTSDGLVIPKMALNLQEVQVGLGSRSLESVGKGLFSAALDENVVSRFISKRAGASVKDVRVAFRDGELQVSGTPEIMGFGVKSEVAGRPVLSGRDAVNFEASKVSVLGLRLPGFAVDELEKRINPVVDLSGLKLPVRITELDVRGDRLHADGTLDFGKLTKSKPKRRR
ncbi:MAG: DUF2993 domain-containing protein [Armatimonadota bacterium]